MGALSEVIRDFLNYRENEDCVPGTLRRYTSELSIWQQWREEQHLPDDLMAVTTEEVRRFFTYLKQERVPHATSSVRPPAKKPGLSAHSRDGYYRLLRSFTRWCVVEALIDEKQIQFSHIPRPKIEHSPRPTYAPDDIDRLIEACHEYSSEGYYRNQAIIFMLLESGIRVNELCSLTDESLELSERRAFIRGKGGKYRHIFWFDDTSEALKRYLEYRRGAVGGRLFRSLQGEEGKPLTPHGVRCLFRRLSERSGVSLAEGAPIHALRHTFARRLLERGGDVSHVSQIMNHSTVQITMLYVRELPERLQRIYEQIMRGKKIY